MSEQELEVEEKVEEPEEKKEPDGKEPLDFNELPEEIRGKYEARFNRIYGNMKQYERIANTLEKDIKTLSEKQQELETATVQDRTERRIEGIKAKTQAAIDSGDIDEAKRLQDELSEFVNESIEKANKREEPKKEDDAYIPPHVEQDIVSFANEIDEETGDFKRPWLQPGHGKYQKAIEMSQEVFAGDDWSGRHRELLAEIDKRLNAEFAPKKQRTDTVLGADTGVTPTKDTGGKLSAEQKEAARFLYPKLSPKDAEARYAKALKEA